MYWKYAQWRCIKVTAIGLVEVRHDHSLPYLILIIPISRTHLTCRYSSFISSDSSSDHLTISHICAPHTRIFQIWHWKKEERSYSIQNNTQTAFQVFLPSEPSLLSLCSQVKDLLGHRRLIWPQAVFGGDWMKERRMGGFELSENLPQIFSLDVLLC